MRSSRIRAPRSSSRSGGGGQAASCAAAAPARRTRAVAKRIMPPRVALRDEGSRRAPGAGGSPFAGTVVARRSRAGRAQASGPPTAPTTCAAAGRGRGPSSVARGRPPCETPARPADRRAPRSGSPRPGRASVVRSRPMPVRPCAVRPPAAGLGGRASAPRSSLPRPMPCRAARAASGARGFSEMTGAPGPARREPRSVAVGGKRHPPRGRPGDARRRRPAAASFRIGTPGAAERRPPAASNRPS